MLSANPPASVTTLERIRAAERGDADAQFEIGKAFNAGVGVKRDDAEAARWYRRAAEQGHAFAQYGLGIACVMGRDGTEQSWHEAARWWRLSADQGHQGAQVDLGRMLIGDTPTAVSGVPTLLKEGARLLGRAAQSQDCAELAYEALHFLRKFSHEREVVRVCCIGCGKTDSLKRCGKCHVARFCGAACQQRMWSTHMPDCRRFAAESAPTAGD